MRSGPYKDAIQRGVIWLKDRQDESDLFGTEAGRAFMYNHAIATIAFVEAYGLSTYKTMTAYAQRAVDYIQQARTYKAWRYYPHDGGNDSSVTAWMACAVGQQAQMRDSGRLPRSTFSGGTPCLGPHASLSPAA